MAKHVSGKAIKKAIEVRKMVGSQRSVAKMIGISQNALHEREKRGFGKEHCLSIISAAQAKSVEISNGTEELKELIQELREPVEDDCEACRLGGKGGEK